MRKIAVVVLLLIQIPSFCQAVTVNVLDLGADRTGQGMSTDAINGAIQQCVQKGGGTVVVPPGRYRTGTIFLESNLTFRLQPGAILLGSRKVADYPDIETCYWQKDAHFLLFAKDAENLTIEGSGIIDGSGDAYWTGPQKGKRPKSIRFRNCRNVTLRDFTLRNSACYNIHAIGCDNVKISGVTIKNPYNSPNTDGLDIDCCSNVRISDCKIDTGDDCIAIKSDRTRACCEKACENISVTNCSLRTSCCGIRIGWEGDNQIRNCTFSNLTIYDTHAGINFVSVLPAGDLSKSFGSSIKEGAKIERVAFSNIVMDNVFRPIDMVMRKDKSMKETPHRGRIKDIMFSDMIIKADSFSSFGGLAENQIENLTLSNIQFVMTASEILEKRISPEKVSTLRARYKTGDKHIQPLNFYHVKNLRLNDLSFSYQAPDDFWGSAIRIRHTENVMIRGLLGGAYSKDFPVLDLGDVNGGLITDSFICRPSGKLFEAENSKGIVVGNNK